MAEIIGTAPRYLGSNRKKRPPLCPVTRAMADAGKEKLNAVLNADKDGEPVTDDQMVSEIFAAMWQVYWEQVFALQGKNLKAPANLVLPPAGLIKPQGMN